MKGPSNLKSTPLLAIALTMAAAFVSACLSARADEVGWAHPKRASVGMGEAQLKECERRAGLHGGSQGPVNLGNDCFDAFFELAPPAANRRSVDGEVFAAGLRNALLTRTVRHDEFAQHIREPLFAEAIVAGSNTGLHSIAALSLDTVNREIAVLESSSGDILFFGVPYEGNIFPLRAIHAGLKDGAAIAVDASASEIAVARKSGALVFYARDASKSSALRQIAGPATQLVLPSGIAVAPSHREVFVSDSVANQVLVYSESAQGNAAPLRVIGGGATRIFQPQAVSYVPGSDTIQVINGDGSLVNFPRDATGDAKPLQ